VTIVRSVKVDDDAELCLLVDYFKSGVERSIYKLPALKRIDNRKFN
jgi:hypothetical protein